MNAHIGCDALVTYSLEHPRSMWTTALHDLNARGVIDDHTTLQFMLLFTSFGPRRRQLRRVLEDINTRSRK